MCCCCFNLSSVSGFAKVAAFVAWFVYIKPDYLRTTCVLPAYDLRTTCVLPAYYLRTTCVLPAYYLPVIHCQVIHCQVIHCQVRQMVRLEAFRPTLFMFQKHYTPRPSCKHTGAVLRTKSMQFGLVSSLEVDLHRLSSSVDYTRIPL